MKIHGGKKDYWDTALGYGVDPTLHYNRKEKELDYGNLKAALPTELTRFLDHNAGCGSWHRNIVDRFVIGFCGRIFPCIYVERALFARGPLEIHYLYDAENAIQVLDLKDLDHSSWFRRHWRGMDPLKAKEFYSFTNSVHDEIFAEINAPIFTLKTKNGRDHIISTNPNLKELQFYKIVDSFTAFQEIAMYLSNQLVRRDKPDEIADKYKISQHGFDPTYSFRKRP